MAATATPTCSGCHRLQQEVDVLRKQVDELQCVITRLEEQVASARKNSSTSSKPPSSDIVKPPKTPPDQPQQRRSRGGQPGHPKHERVLFPPEMVDSPHEYRLELCPDCGCCMRASANPPHVIQQVDVPPTDLHIEEHRSYDSYCSRCDKIHHAPMPSHILGGGLVSIRLTSLIGYLKGFCHASYSTIRTYLRDVVGLVISRGQLVRIITKVSQALEDPYNELLGDLPLQDRLNVDETSHKENGKRMWTWCFRAELYTLFKIDPTRSADVLIKVLGAEFDGVLGCDFFSAYRRYMREFDIRLQFCLAHFIRDVKYLTTLPDKKTKEYGERVREALRELFGVIHDKEKYTQQRFGRLLQVARHEVIYQATHDVPQTRAAQALAKRMRTHGESYFRFITEPGVEPTNNLAEQAIRFVVIGRHITQGTRSEKGWQFCERIWTVVATCAGQGRSVFEYLYAAVEAHFMGKDAPSLLPNEQ